LNWISKNNLRENKLQFDFEKHRIHSDIASMIPTASCSFSGECFKLRRCWVGGVNFETVGWSKIRDPTTCFWSSSNHLVWGWFRVSNVKNYKEGTLPTSTKYVIIYNHIYIYSTYIYI
jgi:hypothetical protein